MSIEIRQTNKRVAKIMWSILAGVGFGAIFLIIALLFDGNHRADDTNLIFIIPPLSAFLIGSLFWFMLVSKRDQITLKRGMFAGAYTSVVCHLLSSFFASIYLYSSGGLREQGAQIGKIVHIITAGLYVYVITALMFAWFILPICALIGACLASIQGRINIFNAFIRLDKRQKFTTASLFFIMCIAIVSGTYAGPPYSGKVIDIQTRQPVEGAVIVRSWKREYATAAGAVSAFEAMKEIITDNDGSFRISGLLHAPSSILSNVRENKPIVYKPGYKFLALDKRTSIIELERVPTVLKIRAEEVDKARSNYEIDIYHTKLLKGVVFREEEFVTSNKDVPFNSVPVKTDTQIARPLFNPEPCASYAHQMQCASGKISCCTPVGNRFGNSLMFSRCVPIEPSRQSFEEAQSRFDQCRRTLRVFSSDDSNAHVAFYSVGTNHRMQYQDESGMGMSPDDCYSPDAEKRELSKNDRASCYVRILSDRNSPEYSRANAALLLGIVGDSHTIDVLNLALSNDTSVSVKSAAAKAVMRIGDSRSTPFLVMVLNNDDMTVQIYAARALGRIKDPAAVPALIEALRRNHGTEARKALIEIGRPACPALISALKDEHIQRDIIAVLGHMPDPDPNAIRPLVTLMDSKDRITAREAAEALGNYKEPEAISALIAVLDNRDSNLSSQASTSLYHIGSAALDYLVEALKSRGPQVKSQIAHILGRIKDQRAVEPLINLWGDQDHEVRIKASEALVQIGTPAVNSLLIALSDKNSYQRWRAAWCLGRIGDPMAISALGALREDRSREVRWTALDALQKMNSSGTLEQIAGFCNDSDIGIREKAAEAISSMTGKDACVAH